MWGGEGDIKNNLKTVQSSKHLHFGRNRVLFLTKYALIENGPNHLGFVRPPAPPISERKQKFLLMSSLEVAQGNCFLASF